MNVRTVWYSFLTTWRIGVFAIFWWTSFLPSTHAQQFDNAWFPYEIQGQVYDDQEEPTIDIAKDILQPDTTNQESMLQTLTRIFRLSDTPYYTGTSPATNYIKWLLNIALGLVSFLAFVMVLFSFYLIFFGKGDEALTKARKILIGVAIALAIMGISWFIVSYFFDLYKTIT